MTDNDGATGNTSQILNVDVTVMVKKDVNGDSQVNAADLLIALQILMGSRIPTMYELAILDVAPLVNGVPTPDGDFNLGDYLVLQRIVLGGGSAW